jgi:hypothetical protein
MSESRLDAAHGQTIHSLHQILDSVRESFQEKERERRVYGDRSHDGGFGKKETSRWLGRDRRRWIAAAGEERDFSQRGAWFAGMNDQLTTAATANDAYPPFEDQRDSLRAIADRPENLARPELPLDGVLEQRISARRIQALEKLVCCVGLAQWSV